MNFKILFKSIFKEILNVLKYIMITILVIALIIGVFILHDLDLLYIWVVRPIVVITGIAFLIIQIWTFYDNIKERYKKELKNKDLEDKEFKVKYKVVYTGIKTIKAKDRHLISLRNFDKRSDDEYSEIKIIKVKEV